MSLAIGELPARRVYHKDIGENLGDTDFQIPLPRDHFIHEIILEFIAGSLSGGTSPAWNSDAMDEIVKALRVVANGNKYFKKFNDHTQAKQICIINKDVQDTGYHKIYFTDPRIPEARPLPSWVFTSLVVELDLESLGNLTTGDPTSGSVTCNVYVVESPYNGEDISGYKVLVEKASKTEAYGGNTGEQEYNLERAYRVFGYLLDMDDNGTRSNTVFDRFDLIGRTKEREFVLKDKVSIAGLRSQNKARYQNALDTGFAYVDFAPKGLDTSVFTSLKIKPNIASAGTNKRLTVVERYLL